MVEDKCREVQGRFSRMLIDGGEIAAVDLILLNEIHLDL